MHTQYLISIGNDPSDNAKSLNEFINAIKSKFMSTNNDIFVTALSLNQSYPSQNLFQVMYQIALLQQRQHSK